MTFKVKAIFDYNSGHEDDLPFQTGQIITVTDEEDADWYGGEYVDEHGVKQEGIFPRNFVEKYEPTAPPRPTRTRTKHHIEQQSTASEPAAPPSPPLLSPKLPAHEPEEDNEHVTVTAPTQTSSAPDPAPAPAPEPPAPKPIEQPKETVTSPPPAPKPAPAPLPTPATSAPAAKPASTQPPRPSSPPPVSEKPSSFKDRIAAFNKAAAPPVAPFKPSGLGGGNSGFIKKPFVAPPPSRNAFIPPVQSAPVAKVYRREEDPEIKEKEAENLETAEKAGLLPGSSTGQAHGDDEEQPKTLTLKERLALLQKQQQEAAQRHADAVAKKEKPKRPAPKKRVESHEGPTGEEPEASMAPPLERRDSGGTTGKKSLDEARPPRLPHPPRRKSSKGPEVHDGNEADMSGAGETTEGQDDELTEKDDGEQRPKKHIATLAKQEDEALNEDEVAPEDEGDEEEEEEDVDPEVRRKEELRARMARIAGGMGGMGGMAGMGGIFGGPVPTGAPAPPKKKKTAPERQATDTSEEPTSPAVHAPPVPTMMALPGMSRVLSNDSQMQGGNDADEEDEDEETDQRTPHQEHAPPPVPSRDSAAVPPLPGGRPAPPAVPAESRPPPPPPPAAVMSPSEGSESGDELSEHAGHEALAQPPQPSAATRAAPPLPPVATHSAVTSPTSPQANRRSYIGEVATPLSPTGAAPPPPPGNKRDSRLPPPVPGSAPAPPPAQSRPPPPPPPGALSRSSTGDNRGPLSPTRLVPQDDNNDNDEEEDVEEEVTEYEGDYDTDIASSVPHKDALKSHQRESSFEDTTSVRSPAHEAPPSFPPPVPSAPRGPPPLPSQPPPETRRSVEVPRAAPPPPPPPKEAPRQDDDYDPYNYASPAAGIIVASPPQPPTPQRRPTEDSYFADPAAPQHAPLPDRRAPPPAPAPGRATTRQSVDLHRSLAPVRRSMDMARPSMESGYVANDVDLAIHTGWWLKPNSVPPQLQGRKDIYFESEESQSSENGRTIVTRDIYVLFQDYSQTVITARYDPNNQSDIHLEQRHEAPPRTLRQDQLEESYERFGRAIGEAVASMKEKVIGDGTPQALVYELLKPHPDALHPVGTRSYGALVYSNLANASTTQNDEIRPGDIISIRNAKFQGKHGPMHAKYSAEVGKPDHVGIVSEWDGTKKKVRAWEQGRESKKVKVESFKLDDLRSGEVKIWRVMPRSWVGWASGN